MTSEQVNERVNALREFFHLEPKPLKQQRSKGRRRKKVPKRHHAIWTKDEDQKVIQMCQEGVTHLEIGKVLGRSEGAVTRRMQIMREGGSG